MNGNINTLALVEEENDVDAFTSSIHFLLVFIGYQKGISGMNTGLDQSNQTSNVDDFTKSLPSSARFELR